MKNCGGKLFLNVFVGGGRMRRGIARLVVFAVAAGVGLSGFAITRHYSFQPRETVGFGGASAVVPVPKKVSDAYDRAKEQQKKKQLSLIGKVVMVADGDMITVQPTGGSKTIVHLAGIAAPKGAEPGAATALNQLSGLIRDKKVTVRYSEKDRAGMVSGVVWFGKVNVNKSMVVSGFAKATDREYEDDQRQARLAKRGIWADAD